MIFHFAFEIIFLTSCGYALLSGGAPERIAAVTFIIAATVSIPAVSGAAVRFAGIEVWVVVIDVLVLAAMVGLALAAERIWPIWMVMMETMQVTLHAAMLLPIDVDRWAYRRGAALWSYPMLIVLGIATALHRRRRIRTGADPSWRSFLRR